jgi:hypothetical protein
MLIVLFVFNLTAAYANTDKPNLDLLSESKDVSTDATTDSQVENLKKPDSQKEEFFSDLIAPSSPKCMKFIDLNSPLDLNLPAGTNCHFLTYSSYPYLKASALFSIRKYTLELFKVIKDPRFNPLDIRHMRIYFDITLGSRVIYQIINGRFEIRLSPYLNITRSIEKVLIDLALTSPKI